jgi:hypothetical protein
VAKLSIIIKHDIVNNVYEIETDVKDSMLKEMLGEVVRSKMGAGEDDSPANQVDVYRIEISIDLSDDSISTSSNCGNKGLETGLILDAFQRLDEKGVVR